MALAVAPAGQLTDEQRFRQELARLCISGQTEKVLYLLGHYGEPGISVASSALDRNSSTALHLAALGGHLKLTQELVASRCEVNARDSRGQTPLHIAAAESSADLVLELLVGKADANATDEHQQTALHKAVKEGQNPEVVRVLLHHSDANPTVADGLGITPAMLAAEFGKFEHLAHLLAQEPSLANAANNNGWTALHLAAQGGELKRRNSRIPAKFRAAVRLLLEVKADVEALDEDRKTPLHRAAAAGNMETVAGLLDGRADVAAADICRWTPLHYACQDGHLEVAKSLIRAKAAVQQENASCISPLAVATMENQVRMAELLVNSKADPNLRNKGMASPMMLARKEPGKYADILSLFELGFISHAD